MKNLLLAAAAVLLLSCHHTKQMMGKSTGTGFDLQGHRGCRGLMPENTVAAFVKALELGVTTLEMDACITADGKVVLSHEPFFNHEITTQPNGAYVTEAEEKSFNIHRMDYAAVCRYDVGMKPHPRFAEQHKMAACKPLLSEVIDTVKFWCVRNGKALPQFNIETKTLPATDHLYHPAPAAFVDILMRVVNDGGIADKTIIQSFDFRTLQYLHQHYPAIKTAALVEDYDKLPLAKQLQKLGFIPTIYSPAHELVTPQVVADCHRQHILLIPWTVNDSATAARLKAWGVDGIITDYPDRIR